MLANQGYEVVRGIISDARCVDLTALLSLKASQAGDRSVLAVPAIRQLAGELSSHPLLARLLPTSAVAVQCTLFDKSPDKNWLVAMHQDLSIPVAQRIDDPCCKGWSIKDDVHYTQPPIEVLQSLVAVRVHLDECGSDNGPLRVVPGSHLCGRWTATDIESARSTMSEVECPISRGCALVMSPLVLHASSKAKQSGHRRVLHFLFGPPELPCGLRWHTAV